MKRLAVIGNPIAHSLSPQMHNAWIADHGLDAIYERVLIENDAAFAAYIKSAGLFGANVTTPFKEAAAAAADVSDARVANTLVWRGDDALVAHNTDGWGFLAALDEAAPNWFAQTILVLGAGGASEGVSRALARPDRETVIANRTLARGQALARTLVNARAEPWEMLPALFAEADLIVQTTTLGMGANESPAWPVSCCKPSAMIAEIVYRPLETPLLAAARARGLKSVDGLGMLIHQGARSFEIWFGVKPDAKKARTRLVAILAEEGG